jgi:hypothetical protein
LQTLWKDGVVAESGLVTMAIVNMYGSPLIRRYALTGIVDASCVEQDGGTGGGVQVDRVRTIPSIWLRPFLVNRFGNNTEAMCRFVHVGQIIDDGEIPKREGMVGAMFCVPMPIWVRCRYYDRLADHDRKFFKADIRSNQFGDDWKHRSVGDGFVKRVSRDQQVGVLVPAIPAVLPEFADFTVPIDRFVEP